MQHKPATPGTATAFSCLLTSTDADRDVAMWAACALMAMHDKRSDKLQEYADSWASKLKPPLST